MLLVVGEPLPAPAPALPFALAVAAGDAAGPCDSAAGISVLIDHMPAGLGEGEAAGIATLVGPITGGSA
jgi:hypothetical protein